MKQPQTPSLTREELYKLVWSKPLSTIEKEFNKLPIDIKNACEKFKIPLPENGHWSKLKFNKQEPIPELEELKDEELKKVQNVLETKEIELSPIKKIIASKSIKKQKLSSTMSQFKYG